ncbi:MAG TPA: hypothetical protein VH589_19950 [Trebonia sp.]|jgi:hypothetical protein
MPGDFVLLLGQVVDFALQARHAPLRLGLRLGADLAGVLARGVEDPLGVAAPVGDDLAGPLVGLPLGLLRLGRHGRGVFPGGCGAPLRLGDQLPGGDHGGGVPLGLFLFGFLATGRELELEVGLRLGAQRLALLEEPLLAHPDLFGLALGRLHDLVVLALRRGLQLRHLAFGRHQQRGRRALARRALLVDLLVDRVAYLHRLLAGHHDQLFGLLHGRGAHRFGVPPPGATRLLGVGPGPHAQRGGVGFRGGPHPGDGGLRGLRDLVGPRQRGLRDFPGPRLRGRDDAGDLLAGGLE